MISTVRSGLALVDAWTRRRVAMSAVLAAGLAALEMFSFALLYLLLRALSSGHVSRPAAEMLVSTGLRRNGQQLGALGCAVVLVMLLKSLLAVLVTRWQTRVQNASEARLATSMFREYLERSFLFHASGNSASLIRNLTSSIGMVATSVVGSLSALIADGLVLLGTLIVLAAVEPGLAGGVAGFAVVVLVGYVVLIGPVIHRAAAADQALTATTMQAMQEAFSGIKSVHVFNVISAVAESYTAQRYRLADSRATLTFAQRLPQYYLEVCLVLGAATATLILTNMVGEERTYALLALLVVAALRILPSVGRILGSLNAIRNGAPAVAVLLSEKAQHPGPAAARRRTVAQLPSEPDAPAAVCFEHVSYRYPDREVNVLTDVTLTIPPGKSIGIVGSSGAGKTTLVDLLLGLLEPTSGRVLADGRPLGSLTRGTWLERVGYVPQDTYLLDASIRENVLFHRQLPSTADADKRIWSALAAAQLTDTVAALPGALEARVGERGVMLSGGQRQRLGIARALLTGPSVLVLDEATSALDSSTEAAIGQTIAKLRGDMTVVIIAHRLSTVRDCDELVLIEAGRVAAVGSLEDLARHSPAFAATLRLADVRLVKGS